MFTNLHLNNSLKTFLHEHAASFKKNIPYCLWQLCDSRFNLVRHLTILK